MTQDDDVRVIRFQNFGCVFERLALRQARRACRNVYHVCAQARSGQFKRSAGARARVDKKVNQRFTSKRWYLLDLASADLLERVGGFENEIDLVCGKFAQPNQIFSVPTCTHSLNNQTASGSPSVCSSRTRTFSLAALGKFLPT